MSISDDLEAIPGKTGEDEVHASSQGGGFAWSRARAAEFGSVCRTMFKGRDAVLLTGEEGLKAFYDTRHVVRSGTKSATDLAFLSDGVTPVVPILDGEAHAARKGALLRVVSPEALARYVPVIGAVIDRHVQRWESVQDIDLKRELQRLSFEALSTVITGAPGDASAAADYGEATQAVFGPDPERHLPARDRLLVWYRSALAEQRRLAPSDAASCMLGMLAHQTALTDDEIVAEVQHIFVGSAGVWAAGCTALSLLAGHPAALERTRDEVRKLPVPPSFAELEGASYLQDLVEEVARWTPIINAQVALAAEPFDVGGHRIPKGTLLVAGLYATNHDPVLYPSPDVFDPERAARRPEAQGAPGVGCPFSSTSPFTYVPFGGGDRSAGHRCLGERLVYLALKLLLARVARDCSWTLVKPDEVSKVPAPYMAPEVLVRFTR